jgi:solute carrier family 35 protein C2
VYVVVYVTYWPSPAVVPNGACTGLDISLSMMSLVFISLSFYTMCKATVPLFLLAFAFLWGIEK